MSPICDIAVYPVIVAAVILFAISEAFHVIEGGTVFLLSSSSIHNRRSKVPKLVLYLRGHQILDSTFRSPEPWLSPVQCLALLQIVRDHCASAEVVVAHLVALASVVRALLKLLSC